MFYWYLLEIYQIRSVHILGTVYPMIYNVKDQRTSMFLFVTTMFRYGPDGLISKNIIKLLKLFEVIQCFDTYGSW